MARDQIYWAPTPEMREIIERISCVPGVNRSQFIEDWLRRHPTVEKWRQELELEWRDWEPPARNARGQFTRRKEEVEQ